MYEDEFVNHMRRRGTPGGVVAYVASVATGAQRDELLRARDYAVAYRDFDWSVNAQEQDG